MKNDGEDFSSSSWQATVLSDGLCVSMAEVKNTELNISESLNILCHLLGNNPIANILLQWDYSSDVKLKKV